LNSILTAKVNVSRPNCAPFLPFKKSENDCKASHNNHIAVTTKTTEATKFKQHKNVKNL